MTDPDFKEFIDGCFETAMNGGRIDRDSIIRMLAVDPSSDECEYMGRKAREIAKVKSKNIGTVATAFGLDYCSCSASCRYCSFGKKWGLVKTECHMPDETVVELVREKVAAGYSRFTLRTTEYYSVDMLCDLGRKIRAEVPGRYRITVNTGELTEDDAKKLRAAGINGAYHTLHLREGTDTPFAPEVRLETMRTISDSELYLSSGVDPIGIEHTNEEIADLIVTLRSYDPVSICSMKRINVKGTPMGDYDEVSDLRIAQIAAVIRFASDKNVSAVPPIRKAMEWGANGTSIGTGANPRDEVHDSSRIGIWRFDHEAVKQMLIDSGYVMEGAAPSAVNVRIQ